MENRVSITKKNAHRVKLACRVSAPEKGAWYWKFRAKRLNDSMMYTEYAHIAKNINSGEEIEVKDNDMTDWTVEEFAYKYNFEDLYDLGVRAYEGTSQVPEVRSLQYIRMYEETLNEDLSKIPESSHEEYYKEFKAKVEELFRLHSRILSSFITGPARFPTSRNNKNNSAYDSAEQKFADWREYRIKKVLKAIEASKPEHQRQDEAWEALKKEIIRTSSNIISIDNGNGGGYSRNLFVNSIVGKVETFANHGNVFMVEQAINLINEINAKQNKPVITKRNKFFTLLDVAKAKREAEEERANKDSVEIEFEGGKLVKNYELDRLQIIFDEKPNEELRTKMKMSGLKWSPKNSAWQRQITASAELAISRIIPVTVEQMRSI